MTEPLGKRIPAAPEPTVETVEYWQAADAHKLMIGRCHGCGEAYFYPRSRCPRCLSADTGLEQAEGSGTVYSYSIMRRAKIPYAIAYVTLAEGPTMMTNIVDCAIDHISIGMPVSLVFVESDGGSPVPVFKPAGEFAG
ncbi:OB-fold domain-containing protein [Hoeflea sp. G2-23]|uniref:OB-fold domain-containing protein n=1 Tax=Hoeflea algicola TaxID=2983763 RepID=A0ABT3ZEP5_9HYPH|nr:OB-fold domain-containing protein [Hoeflea algicola]MCY0150188.1 OB-fold domain-containing protein [Hoeflea algicola]